MSVVTTLEIDADGAVRGADQFAQAMERVKKAAADASAELQPKLELELVG